MKTDFEAFKNGNMRIWLVILVFALSAVTVTAQSVSRRYDGVSMSEALADIAKSSDYYKINFIYDELDEFPVTCHFYQQNIIDAIMLVIGHYPVKVTIRGQYIFVECVEKRQTKVRGRVLGVRSAPLPNANITVFDARTGEIIHEEILDMRKELYSIQNPINYETTFTIIHIAFANFGSNVWTNRVFIPHHCSSRLTPRGGLYYRRRTTFY